ncbi:hypothetical protein Tsubulata_004874, partial [Turnera subulata]
MNMVMEKLGLLFFIFSLLPSLLLLGVLVDERHVMGVQEAPTTNIPVPVGVVLDLGSPVGEMAERCMSIAVSDFDASNALYRTRVALVTRDSSTDAVTAASAGPQRSSQANFVIDLGGKAQVPIISPSSTSPSLYSARRKYF